MLFGASYQLVPVVLQTPLASVRIGRLSFWCYVIGLALFLGGLWRAWLPGLSSADRCWRSRSPRISA